MGTARRHHALAATLRRLRTTIRSFCASHGVARSVLYRALDGDGAAVRSVRRRLGHRTCDLLQVPTLPGATSPASEAKPAAPGTTRRTADRRRLRSHKCAIARSGLAGTSSGEVTRLAAAEKTAGARGGQRVRHPSGGS